MLGAYYSGIYRITAGRDEVYRKSVGRVRKKLASRLEVCAVEFIQGGYHCLRVLTFPASSLTFHTMMDKRIDAALDYIHFQLDSPLVGNGQLHHQLATFKVSGRLIYIAKARNSIPIQNMECTHDLTETTMQQGSICCLANCWIGNVPSPNAALATFHK